MKTIRSHIHASIIVLLENEFQTAELLYAMSDKKQIVTTLRNLGGCAQHGAEADA
jgi:hypothetical protein